MRDSVRFSPDFLDDIRSRLPISSIVGQRVTFDNRKSNPSRGDFWACCPFHSEKSPSFHCEDSKGRYHCFGCGESGDIFGFICKIDGLSFPEAIERLADYAGIKLPKRDKDSEKREKIKTDLYDVMAMASQEFSKSLQNREGQVARHYLQERHLPKEIIKNFHIGFALNEWSHLKDTLLSRGVRVDQMEACGLIAKSENDTKIYDRFRNRIMFPILDLRGRVVAFGGRALESDARAKYLNSPETLLFHKGNMLYNAANARKFSHAHAGQAPKPILVVEGYMDVIALAKAGFHQAVAPLGTALTDEQIMLLWRMGQNPILCFDGDSAGLKAAYRAAERILPLLKAGVSARFILLPHGKDPDDIINMDGASAFAHEIEKAIPLAQLLWQRHTDGQVFQTPEERANLERQLKAAIFSIKDESLRHYYLQDMRERLRQFFRPIFPNHYQEQKGRKGSNNLSSPSSNLANSNLVKKGADFIPVREAAILLTLANHPSLWYENFEILAALDLPSQPLASLHSAMLQILSSWQPNDADAMQELLVKHGQKQTLLQISTMLRNLGMLNAFKEAPIEDARISLNQALYLYQRANNLHKQLRDIEKQLLESTDSQIFSLLSEVKAELAKMETIQSIVEGFGQWRKGETL